MNSVHVSMDNYAQVFLVSFSVKEAFLTGFPLSGTIPRFAAVIWLRLSWLLCLIIPPRSMNIAGCLNWSFPRQGHLVICGRYQLMYLVTFSRLQSLYGFHSMSPLVSCWDFLYYVLSPSPRKELVGKFQLEHLMLGFIKAKLFKNYGFSDM